MKNPWRNSTSSLHAPFEEGGDHVTSSGFQSQGSRLSNLGAWKEGCWGLNHALPKDILKPLPEYLSVWSSSAIVDVMS